MSSGLSVCHLCHESMLLPLLCCVSFACSTISGVVDVLAIKPAFGGGGAGLDLNAIPGFNPAKNKAILDAANKKDKFRQGA